MGDVRGAGAWGLGPGAALEGPELRGPGLGGEPELDPELAG